MRFLTALILISDNQDFSVRPLGFFFFFLFYSSSSQCSAVSKLLLLLHLLRQQILQPFLIFNGLPTAL